MGWFRIVLALVLLDFLGLTGWVVYEYGYLGFFELANANWATRLLMADLVISLTLIASWMVRDAREREISCTPYLVATAFLGAAGPLLYLIRRPEAA